MLGSMSATLIRGLKLVTLGLIVVDECRKMLRASDIVAVAGKRL